MSALLQPQVFTGDYLGPLSMPLPIVATGLPVGTAGGAALRTTACAVVGAGHTFVTCAVPAGVGAGYTWSLTVAGQSSSPSIQATSYGPASVTAVAVTGSGVTGGDEPGAVPTAGGATVTLLGVNFGADASRIVVAWNGTVAPSVALAVPHTVLSFTSLPGQGVGVNVTLTVGGQPAGSVIRIPFAAPRVMLLRLDTTIDSGASLDCSEVDADGRPATGSGSGQRAVVVIRGVNFGSGEATVATIRDIPCVLRAVIDDRQIVCQTSLCTGSVM